MSIVKISIGQEALESAFEGYKVVHSRIVCDIHRCTDGNRLRCTDDKVRNFKRYINVKRKTIYWCFSDEYIEIND